MTQRLKPLLWLFTGFCAGWLGHAFLIAGIEVSREAPVSNARSTDANSRTNNNPVVVTPPPPPGDEREQASDRRTISSLTSPSAPQPETSEEAAGAISKGWKDKIEQLQLLLNERRFQEAIDFYVDAERSETTALLKALRKTIIDTLKELRKQRLTEDFNYLSNVFLAKYYQDIDVLLLQAGYFQDLGYLAEAINTYQVAFTYAGVPVLKRQVRDSFRRFISDVDKELSHGSRWYDLQVFYQQIEMAGLMTPLYRIRQAVIYNFNGQQGTARRMLTQLADDPNVGSRAQETLAMLEGDQKEAPLKTANILEDVVELQRVNDHFVLATDVNRHHAVNLLIDTGASITAVSRSWFEKIRNNRGYEYTGRRRFNTANGPTWGVMFVVDTFKIGRYELENIEIAVMNIESDSNIDGLLGMNVLRNFKFHIDQDRNRLYLEEREQ